MKTFIPHALAALMLVALPAAAWADGPIAATSTEAAQPKFQQDRQYILGMAGQYKVKFDFRETTPWQADYTPIESKISGGNEVVLVIEDIRARTAWHWHCARSGGSNARSSCSTDYRISICADGPRPG